MNNTMLSTALITLLCSTAYAENTPQPSTSATAAAATAPTPATAPAKPAEAVVTTAPVAPQAPTTVDCHYRIPAETNTIEESLVSTWAKKAAVQSFEFNPATIDEELGTLKACYTDQGWQGFNEALQKSGNINAIKSQHLTVSSQVDGNITINSLKDNQWKVTVPMQVVYQNEKDKLTQLLSVDLLIGRKISGDLGIMQMIATPRPSAAAPTTATEPTSTAAPATPQTTTPAVENTTSTLNQPTNSVNSNTGAATKP